MEILKRAMSREPAAILTVLLIAIQAMLDAMSVEGWTWQTLASAAITALVGVTIRESVYSRNTRDHDVAKAADEGYRLGSLDR